MREYFNKMKVIVDNLTMFDSPVSNDDFILHLLQGIPMEYDSVIANVNCLPTSLDVEDVLAHWRNQKIWIQSMNTEPALTAYAAKKD